MARTRKVGRPGLERLESRSLPSAVGFLSGFGIGASGAPAAIHANAVAVAPGGDSVVVGSFRGTAAFGPSTSISTVNTQDAFVAEYSSTGTLLWVDTFAGRATTANGFTTYAVSQASAVAVDSSGDVYLAGAFSGTLAAPGGSNLSCPAGTTEPFAAKLGPSGQLAWVATVAGTAYDDDEAYAVAPDGSGGAFIAGSFSDSAAFGPTILVAGGSSDAFVAHLNSSGGFAWAVATRGSSGSNAAVEGLAVDPSGRVDLAGFFSGTVDFDPSAGVDALTSAGSDDAMVWQLSGAGQFDWARDFGSPDVDEATGVAVDASGDVYATGFFSDSVNFGTAANPQTLTAGPVFDAFAVKLDPSGDTTWADGLVGPGWSKGQGIAVDSSGDVDLVGTFSGTVDFDPGTNVDDLTSVGSTDVFAVGLGPSGGLDAALQAGESGANAGLGIAVDTSGVASAVGTSSGPIAFGSSSVAANGSANAFVARAQLVPPPPTPPSPPSAPVLEASSDTGPSQSDGITSDTSPVFDVTVALPTAKVELLRDGSIVGTRTGPGAIADPGPVAPGTHAYTAIQVSTAGLASLASPPTSITILTTPPAAPPMPTLLPADDSGTKGDGITDVRTPHIGVVAPANCTIQLVSGTTVLASQFVATAETVWLVPTSPLADGAYSLQARAVDLAGNVGAPSPALALTILGTPPPAPGAPTIDPLDVSGPAGSNLTNVRQPRIQGQGQAGTTVEILNTSGATVLATATVGSNGTYTAQISNPLADGTYTLDAEAVDVAGNVSQPSPGLTITIDGTPPAAPTGLALLGSDQSGSVANLTNVRQPHLTGSAEPGSTVQILNSSNNVVASATATASGAFVAQMTSPLADGSYAFRARAIDPAGNVGPAGSSLTLTILATPPAAPSAPVLLASDDSGTKGDDITNVRQPHLTGSATSGLTVLLENASGSVLGSTVASSGGAVSVAPSAPLADGTYVLHFVAEDAAGNMTPSAGSLTLRILGTPPAQPAAPGLLAADDTGVVGDGMTDVRRPRLVGSAPAGDRVDWVSANGSVEATTTATSSGTYQIQPTSALTNGVYAVQVRVTDVAGNVSILSPSFNLTIRADPADYYGDGQTDLAVISTGGATFTIQRASTGALFSKTYGYAGDVPVVGDFFGDGHADVAVYRPSISTFYAFDPATNASESVQLGNPGDVPVPADFDGDGKTDFAVFRPSNDTFYVLMSSTNVVVSKTYAIPGDIPVPADYLGNGHADYAVYRPSTGTFYVTDPTSGVSKSVAVGPANSVPVPADYEGLGHADFAVFQPSSETFSILMSATNKVYAKTYALAGDIPAIGDYFGDGRADIAVFRPSTSTFYAFDIATGAQKVAQWGTAGKELPVLAPITEWFSFGGGGVGTPSFVVAPRSTILLMLPDLGPSSPTRKAPALAED